MESDLGTPKFEALREMSYSELKKVAKKHGIKGNMKAQKIIDAILSLNPDDVESFSTPAQKEINSSRKNKEEKLNEDQMTPLPTPRRGTYSIESASEIDQKEEKDKMTTVPTPKCELFSTDSPAPKADTSVASSVFDASLLDMSNVTLGRGSERKAKRKVSFLSPARMTPSTPKNPSIKMRPKTPIATRASLGKRVSFSSPVLQQKRRSSEKVIRTTPHPKNSLGKRHSVFSSERSERHTSTPLPSVTETPEKQDDVPSVQLFENDRKSPEAPVEAPSVEVKQKSPAKQDHTTPGIKIMQSEDKKSRVAKPRVTRSQAAAKAIQFATPGSTKAATKEEVSAKIKRTATPNFKKIHEKAFEKMESIDDYQKRKLVNSARKIDQRPTFRSKIIKAKSKIPAYSGVPFVVPDVKTAAETSNIGPRNKNMGAASKENAVQRKKSKFDLKASLSRKLGYIPYRGPVKPLTESNALNTTVSSCAHTQKEPPVNKVVTTKRLQTRSVLKGVRTNKRFELQMKNRNLLN